jgi:hypothetical protein
VGDIRGMRSPANPFYGQPPKGILDDLKRECDVGWAQIFRFTQDDNFYASSHSHILPAFGYAFPINLLGSGNFQRTTGSST